MVEHFKRVYLPVPEVTAVQFMTENLRIWFEEQKCIGVNIREKANRKRIQLKHMPKDSGLRCAQVAI